MTDAAHRQRHATATPTVSGPSDLDVFTAMLARANVRFDGPEVLERAASGRFVSAVLSDAVQSVVIDTDHQLVPGGWVDDIEVAFDADGCLLGVWAWE